MEQVTLPTPRTQHPTLVSFHPQTALHSNPLVRVGGTERVWMDEMQGIKQSRWKSVNEDARINSRLLPRDENPPLTTPGKLTVSRQITRVLNSVQ